MPKAKIVKGPTVVTFTTKKVPDFNKQNSIVSSWKKFLPTFVLLALVVSLLGNSSMLVAAASDGSVTIDTINGQPPTGVCIAGAITVTGHGEIGRASCRERV